MITEGEKKLVQKLFGQFRCSYTLYRPFDHYLLTLMLHKTFFFPTKRKNQNVKATLFQFCLFFLKKIKQLLYYIVFLLYFALYSNILYSIHIICTCLCLNILCVHTPICSSRHGPVYQAVRSATLLLVVRFSPDRPLVGM